MIATTKVAEICDKAGIQGCCREFAARGITHCNFRRDNIFG